MSDKGTIKGVPFVDTPQESKKSPFITVPREDWEAAQRDAQRVRWALAIAGMSIALAIIGVSNIWR